MFPLWLLALTYSHTTPWPARGAALAGPLPPAHPAAPAGGMLPDGHSRGQQLSMGSLWRRCGGQTGWTTGLIQLGTAKEEQRRNKALLIPARSAESECLMLVTQK